ncbi:MAG: serine/threonine protein kinase [Deltaproteobacteria bacterium]|nr:serine/threonine protein kinase [Deltaproteobacteria bacterium]
MERLGRYRIDSKLAEGGMGSVYLGSDVDGRIVVLKVPHRHDDNSLAAMGDEARTGMRLKHPAIVETLDYFVDNGRGVLVVAWIEGKTLYELRRAGPLPPAAVATLGQELAGALDAIHSATDESGRPLNVLHRDISPNNVMIDASGQARLIDLGIARSSDRQQKSTQIGVVKGTLRYLAPEILAGGDHTRVTDLWALGVTLWEAALARYAVPGDEVLTIKAAMDGTLTKLQPSEKVDPDLSDAIHALVAPNDRRLKNARAASAVFTRLAGRMAGGREALAAAVRAASAPAAPKGKPASPSRSEAKAPPPDATELVSRTLLAPALPSKSDVDMVFTMTVPKELVMPSGLAPTMRLDEEEYLRQAGLAPSDEASLQDSETPLEPRHHVPSTDTADTIMMDPVHPAIRAATSERSTDKSVALDVIVIDESDEETEV